MSDLTMISWVLVVIAQAHRARESGYAGQVAQGFSLYYVDEAYRRELDLWAEKGLEAARQEAQDGIR